MALWLYKQGCWKHQGRSNWHDSHSQNAQTGFPLLFNQIGWRKNVSDDLSWELITFQSWINNKWLQWWLSLKCASSFGRMCWVAWVPVCTLWVIWSCHWCVREQKMRACWESSGYSLEDMIKGSITTSRYFQIGWLSESRSFSSISLIVFNEEENGCNWSLWNTRGWHQEIKRLLCAYISQIFCLYFLLRVWSKTFLISFWTGKK